MGRSISRRMFLQGAGGYALAIPFLPSLLPRTAWGQQTAIIKRYFNIVGNYDYGHHQHWFPTLAELPLAHTPANGDQAFRYQTLRSYVPNSNSILSPIFGSGLNPYVNKMNLFRGLNLHTRIAHGRGHMLGSIRESDGHDSTVTSLKALPTIDQVLGSTRSFTPHNVDPLNIGHAYSYRKDAAGNVTRASYRFDKPHTLFASLFRPGGNPIPETGNTSTQASPRADVLSRVMEDYGRVVNGRQISAVDRQILDNALDRISDIQKKLGITTAVAGCQYSDINPTPAAQDGVPSLYEYSWLTHPHAFRLYAEIFAAAASCDLHRVFNFHNGIPESFDRHSSEDFHQGHSHQPWAMVASNGNKTNHIYMGEIWRLLIDNFLVHLVRELDSIPEGNGRSILDNSLVHMTLESSTLHNDSSKPCLMIGSAGGALTTGHYIDYSRRNIIATMQGDLFTTDPNDSRFGHCYAGIHYNRSLTTILRAMGLQPAQYEDPTINTFFQGRTDGLIGAQNNGISRIGGYGHIGAERSGVWDYTDAQMYSMEYARQNYNFYKDSLPMPPGSAV